MNEYPPVAPPYDYHPTSYRQPQSTPTDVPQTMPRIQPTPADPTSAPTPTATPDCNFTFMAHPNAIPIAAESKIVRCYPEAAVTIGLIRANGPFPYPRDDDGFYGNDTATLPGSGFS